MIASDTFGPLCASLRRAEALGHDPDALLARVTRLRALSDAHDPAAVLHARLDRALATNTAPPSPGRLIAGLIPPVLGATTPVMDAALHERQAQIQRRAEALLDTAIDHREPWVRNLSAGKPHSVQHDSTWRNHALTVTASRDRYAFLIREHGVDGGIGSGASQSDATLVAHAAGAARTRAELLLQVTPADHRRPTPRPAVTAISPERR